MAHSGYPANISWLPHAYRKDTKNVTPHTLRHTFATDLYRDTKNILLVQKALGHSNLSTSMIYTHIVDFELYNALKDFQHRDNGIDYDVK